MKFFPKALEDNTASIVISTVGKYYQYRINVSRNLFSPEITHVEVKIKKNARKIYFKKCISVNGNPKKLNVYSEKSKIFYIPLPKEIEKLGFKKSKYKIRRSKNQNTYFYISRKGEINNGQGTQEENTLPLDNKETGESV